MSHRNSAAILTVCLLITGGILSAADTVALKPDDVNVLKTVISYSKRLATNTGVQYQIRVYVVQAINRAHETLDDWSAPSVLSWYTERLIAEKNDQIEEALMNGAIAASRGKHIHLGGVRAFLLDLENKYREAHKYLGYRSKQLTESFEKFAQRRHADVARHLRPITIQAPNLRYLENLRPFTK